MVYFFGLEDGCILRAFFSRDTGQVLFCVEDVLKSLDLQEVFSLIESVPAYLYRTCLLPSSGGDLEKTEPCRMLSYDGVHLMLHGVACSGWRSDNRQIDKFKHFQRWLKETVITNVILQDRIIDNFYNFGGASLG